MENLNLIKQDIEILGLIDEIISKHGNSLAEDQLKVYKDEMVNTCISIIDEVDSNRLNNISMQAVDKHIKIINLLVGEFNKMVEISSKSMMDIINGSIDNDVKLKALEWTVNTFKEIKSFNDKYAKGVQELKQSV